ncbi:MAG: ATP-binding protein [Nitrospirae bacterium]|nr:ATP-binding protein [Nitrospirota bacterium]
MNYTPSIRQKITLGYFAIVAMIIGLSVFTFLELRYIEKKIMFGEAISEFFDTSLEIRRFEKNYFLYGQQSDYDENIQYVSRARDIIDSNIKGFTAIAPSEQISSLQAGLNEYKDLMELYAKTGGTHPARKTILAANIRSTGKDIITIAEGIAKTERKDLQQILSSSRHVLLVSIVFLSLAAIAIGQVLSRMVVKPLKSLEQSMGVIAEGAFERISIDSRDREIVSLMNAFNKMLKQLELHERHLIQSEKLASLGTLLAGVAHELNNPLSNISSSNQILMEELQDALEEKSPRPWPLDPDLTKELMSQINEQTDRARNIVRSLLDFSRDREFKKESLSLKHLFDETIQFVKGQVPTKIGISLSIPEDIMIFADKQRMQQALLNLIKNAIDAISPDEGTITIKAVKRRAMDDLEDEEKTGIYNYLKYRGKCTLDQDTVDIEIQDSGSGIPHDIVSKIFDPFFTTKDVGKGSGLGLFIVHEIIEEHDGCIAVDSQPGKGTRFLIRLPLKDNA